MKEKEKTVKEIAENLIKNKENIYIEEKEKAVEISKMIEINQKDYKQDEKKITDLEKELVEKKEEIPKLEASIKDYSNTKTLLEEDLPNKELEAEKKIAVANDKEKEVERLKALLERAEKELESANNQKEIAITSRDNTKNRIDDIDTLIKNNNDKITENKEKIPQIVQWSVDSDRETIAKMVCELSNTDLREEIQQIQVPTLVLLESVFSFSKNKIEQQYAKLPKKELKYANKGLHFVMYDDYDWYIQQLKEFIQ